MGNYGQLQVFNQSNSRWMPVCKNAVDDKTTDLICREFGYSKGKTFCCNIHNENGVGTIQARESVIDVTCKKDSKSFEDCSITSNEICTDHVSLLCSNEISEEKGSIFVKNLYFSFYFFISRPRNHFDIEWTGEWA